MTIAEETHKLATAVGGDMKNRQTKTVTPNYARAVPTNMDDALLNVLTPRMFGAKGNDPTFDDGVGLNRMFDAVRESLANAGSPIRVDLSGWTWNIVTSVNATGLVAWNLLIQGGYLVGKCTGKAVLDLVGSRGYKLEGVQIHGDKARKPSVAIQTARRTEGDFADNQEFSDVATTGWFSRAAIHCYGHETAKHSHCTYFNYEHTARVAIFEGFNGHPFTSEYTTVMSGPTSFINNNVDTCDFRYLPMEENITVVTGVTNAASAVVTVPAGHSWAVGDRVTFAHVGGLPGLQQRVGSVTARTATTVTVNVDTRVSSANGMGTYAGGGVIIRCATKASVYLSRAEQFNFVSSYIVAYGQPHLEIGFPDAGFKRLERIDLDLLFEGSGNIHNVYLNGAGNNALLGFSLKTYNSNAIASIIGHNTAASAPTFSFYAPEIESVDQYNSNAALIMQPYNIYSMFGAKILFHSILTAATGAMQVFRGDVTEIATGQMHEYGKTHRGRPLYASADIRSGGAANRFGLMAVSIDGTVYGIPLHEL